MKLTDEQKKLAEQHFALALRMADDYKSRVLSLDVRQSVASEALVEATLEFDPARGSFTQRLRIFVKRAIVKATRAELAARVIVEPEPVERLPLIVSTALTWKERIVIKLLYWEDMSQEYVASLLGMGTIAFREFHHEALKKIKENL